MRILGIETSCDETSAAVVDDGVQVLANIVSSQVPVHRKYGGVVPELASRAHLEAVLPIVEMALDRAQTTLDQIDALAVTRGPGLIGALMVGVHTAKAIAFATGKPLVGVNHIEAHLAAIQLADEQHPNPPEVSYPHVALAVSGGHTALYRIDEPGALVLLGQTLDDAAGEAFDKVSTMLGLGYPGGRVIDDLARSGAHDHINFPRAWLGTRHNFFSFSGLKTSVKNYLHTNGVPTGSDLADLCASFQEAVVHVLVRKTLRAAKVEGVDEVVIAGGVAANSRLRAVFQERGRRMNCKVHLTPIRYCSDNAAMIAGLGHAYLKQNQGVDLLSFDADSGLRVSS